MKTIDAGKLYYKLLNEKIREAVDSGYRNITVNNVSGQYYIGDGIMQPVKIDINGIPGNDLGIFMNGPSIYVHGDAQDGIGNTMSGGKIVVEGNAGDVLGYSMRGGRIYVKGNAGYRTCIHMKSYKDDFPVVIIGGKTGEFAGEYMAGGVLIILDLLSKTNIYECNFIGAGMHGGMIIVRGKVNSDSLGKEVKVTSLLQDDLLQIKDYLFEYCQELNIDYNEVMKSRFTKIIPATTRPYKNLYINGFLH